VSELDGLAPAADALRDWVAAVVGDEVSVVVGPPRTDAAVAVHLLGLTQRKGSGPLPRGLAARYLLAAGAHHRHLGDVVTAALARGDLDVDLDGPEPAWWSAMGCAPQPSLVVTVPLRPPPVERAPHVREPLVLHVATAVEGD
jgi:hypothetical protein